MGTEGRSKHIVIPHKLEMKPRSDLARVCTVHFSMSSLLGVRPWAGKALRNKGIRLGSAFWSQPMVGLEIGAFYTICADQNVRGGRLAEHC